MRLHQYYNQPIDPDTLIESAEASECDPIIEGWSGEMTISIKKWSARIFLKLRDRQWLVRFIKYSHAHEGEIESILAAGALAYQHSVDGF